MSNLYELEGNLLRLQDLMESSEIDADVFSDTLEAIEGEYEDKLENYCKVIANLQSDVDSIIIEEDRLKSKKKTYLNNIDRLKKSMYDSMKATNTKKVKGALFTVSIQKNGGVAPIVYDKDMDTSSLPDDLVIVDEKPDLKVIRERLESGEKVEGFELGDRGDSLRIK